MLAHPSFETMWPTFVALADGSVHIVKHQRMQRSNSEAIAKLVDPLNTCKGTRGTVHSRAPRLHYMHLNYWHVKIIYINFLCLQKNDKFLTNKCSDTV